MTRSLSLLLLCALAVPATAVEVYRCVEDGGVSFQQSPCTGPGSRLEAGEVQTGWSGLRSGERQLYRHYLRQEKQQRNRLRHTASHSSRKPAGAGATTCYNKRYQLEKVQAQLRAGYRAGQGEKLRRRRDYLEGYLARFCRGG